MDRQTDSVSVARLARAPDPSSAALCPSCRPHTRLHLHPPLLTSGGEGGVGTYDASLARVSPSIGNIVLLYFSRAGKRGKNILKRKTNVETGY